MRVVVNRTIKNIVKMQYKDGALYVTANLFASRNKIKKLISENADWINAHKQAKEVAKTNTEEAAEPQARNIKRIDDAARGQQQLIKDIYAGKKTMVLGDVVTIAEGVSSKTYLDGSTLYVGEKYYNDRALRLKAIKSYLKKIAFLFVASEVSAFGTSVSLCPQKIEFKDIADTWCKCSLAAQKILCFDYRLTQLPQNLRNYVIAHAFAHFRFASHNDAFWNHVSNVIPHYEDVEKQLENYDFLKDI